MYAFTHHLFSGIGVCGFFVISGYLIHQSLQRSSSLLSFARKRALRIFPGLITAILFTTIVIGPGVSTLNLAAYFTSRDTLDYALFNIFLLPGRETLPGVFTGNLLHAANGSLWTLRYELILYALLGLLFFVPPSRKRRIMPALLTLFLLFFSMTRYGWIDLPVSLQKFSHYFSLLGSYFCGGVVFSLYTDQLSRYKSALALLSMSGFLISLFLFPAQLEVPGMVCFMVMTICIGLHDTPALNFSRYTGDISYGTYIYAYPLQQALLVWFHPSSTLAFMIPSFLLSWTAGLLSWHLVEKRFIHRKRVNN